MKWLLIVPAVMLGVVVVLLFGMRIYYAISVNLLYDFPFLVRSKDDSQGYMNLHPNAYLRKIEPIGRAGHSIRIYSAEQVRDAFAAPRGPPLWDNSETDVKMPKMIQRS